MKWQAPCWLWGFLCFFFEDVVCGMLGREGRSSVFWVGMRGEEMEAPDVEGQETGRGTGQNLK